MATATADFGGDGTLTFEDGQITGDPILRYALEQPLEAEYAVRGADAPSYPTAAWRTDPWAFVAACRALGADPVDVDDMPRLPGMHTPAGAV